MNKISERLKSLKPKKGFTLKKQIGVLSVVVGMFAYLYLVVTTTKGTGEGLSFTTFALWSAIAWIAGFSMLKQGANPAVPMIYGIGSTATAIVLVCKGRFYWTTQDTIVAVLVVICVVLWMTSGPKWALISSVAAGVIAAVPFIILTWKSPATCPIIPNAGFLLANILMLISAKAWTLEDRLYAVVNVVVCSFLVLPWLLY